MRWLIWDKGQREFSLADFEMAWSSENKASRIFDYSRAKARLDGKVHPTQKPVALFEWCIEMAKDCKIVVDTFLGSGTTIIAAENLARQCRAVEISPAYVAVALQRYQDAFGIAPELITAETNE